MTPCPHVFESFIRLSLLLSLSPPLYSFRVTPCPDASDSFPHLSVFSCHWQSGRTRTAMQVLTNYAPRPYSWSTIWISPPFFSLASSAVRLRPANPRKWPKMVIHSSILCGKSPTFKGGKSLLFYLVGKPHSRGMTVCGLQFCPHIPSPHQAP